MFLQLPQLDSADVMTTHQLVSALEIPLLPLSVEADVHRGVDVCLGKLAFFSKYRRSPPPPLDW